MSSKIRIAIYMRLSKEDEILKDESNSIHTQRMLLKEYIIDHFENYEILEFQDDGYTGTNLNRPGLLALLELVKESALDCIIVKDFSRFSRDYIELGSYREEIFPFMGIRFISINDNYDSDNRHIGAGDLDISFKTLLYDLYSKDLSKKVKASLIAKKEKGQYVSGHCPFGYHKALDDRHVLVIEEDEASIVKRIFEMTLQGYTSFAIAKIFNKEGVKTPLQFQIEKGKTNRKPKGGHFIWSSSTICQILRNEVYVGDMVYGKYQKDNVGGNNQIKPKTQWKVFYNHHEPIIDRKSFEWIQYNRGKVKNLKFDEKNPLSGKLICACCGRNLQLRKGLNPYFICPSLYVNPKKNCIRKANVRFLEQYILMEIQNKIQEAIGMDCLQKKRIEELEQKLIKWVNKKQELQTEQVQLQKKKIKYYEKYKVETKKSEENPDIYKKEFVFIRNREEKLQSCLNEAKHVIEEMKEEKEKRKNDSELLAYFGLSQLTRQILQEFIKDIIVYDEQQIKINWNEKIKDEKFIFH